LPATGGGPSPRRLPPARLQTADVKEFGAKGDGVTDDTAAVLSAVDAAVGGAVYFPAGTYKLSRQLVVNSGVVLR
jgi:polygalacturonase